MAEFDPAAVPVYSFGPYKVFRSARILQRDGEVLPISPKVMLCLLVLLEASGRVVTKAQLFAAVWPDSFVEDSNLTQNIWVLRKLFAADYPDGSSIETVARVGYRFAAAVIFEQLERESPAFGSPRTLSGADSPVEPVVVLPLPEHASPAAIDRPGRLSAEPLSDRRLTFAFRRPIRVIAACCLFLLAAVTAVVLRRGQNDRARVSAAGAGPRVALLPFTNLSGAPEEGWLSSALRETLFTDLTASTRLRMTPEDDVRRALRELRLTSDDNLSRESLDRLCRDVDCDRVVSGSYLVSGGQIRVDAHLMDAGTGETLLTWSRTGPVDHLIPLIEETSSAVRKTLGAQGDGLDLENALNASVSNSPEAYKLYLQGLDDLHDYDGGAAATAERRSIELDPSYPLSHLALSSSYTIMGEAQEAVAEAKQAKALDARLPREQQLQIDAQVAGAERHFDDAANVTHTLYTFYPDNPHYLMQTAANLSYAGHPDKAIEILRPLTNAPGAANDPALDSIVADCYSFAGDWPNSLRWARAGADASQRRGAAVLYGRLLTTEAQALLYLHQLAQAEAESQQALSIARDFSDTSGEMRALNRMGQVETELNHLPEAETVLKEALALGQREDQMQRQLHTLSALGHLRAKQGDAAGANAFFAQELALANKFNQPEFTLGAELDVTREQWLAHHDTHARETLEQIQKEAVSIHDRQLEEEAKTALLSNES